MIPSIFARGNQKTLDNLRALHKEAIKDKEPRVALRIQGIMLSLQEYSVSGIARLLNVHRSTVYMWIVAWNECKIDAIYEGYRSGRPRKMDETKFEELKDIVESGPVAYGLNTGVWTSPLISQVIEEEFDVEYHPGHVRKILKRLGFSVQRPTTSLVQADPEKQRKWVRYTYPNLKKKPRQSKR